MTATTSDPLDPHPPGPSNSNSSDPALQTQAPSSAASRNILQEPSEGGPKRILMQQGGSGTPPLVSASNPLAQAQQSALNYTMQVAMLSPELLGDVRSVQSRLAMSVYEVRCLAMLCLCK